MTFSVAVAGDVFQRGWFQDVPKLIAQVDTLYRRLEEKGKPGKLATTKAKMYMERGWEPSRSLIEAKFDEVLTRLGFFYVPKGFVPGPIFVMPQKDLSGAYTRAQSKPLYEIVNQDIGGVSSKYRVIGVSKDAFDGPVWLGNDPETLQEIIDTRTVNVVEGGFDLAATRLVAPPKFPTLCPLTKKLGAGHIAYLRMLGVKQLNVMFDNERGKFQEADIENDKSTYIPKFGQRNEGAGNYAMRKLQEEARGMTVERIDCPGMGDPSDALRSWQTARRLRSILKTFV